jgi:hypothetical protein
MPERETLPGGVGAERRATELYPRSGGEVLGASR